MQAVTKIALFGLGAALLLGAQDPQGTPDPAVERGRELFDRPFHRSGGLGSPEMNANSCRACHSDPEMGGAGPLELNVSRFARDNNGAGPYENLPTGQALSKLRPPFVVGREECPPEADVFEQRQTPSLFGNGLIDSIPGFVIRANEDPNDIDQDGIRGVARLVEVNGVTEVGRFGWKAQLPRLRDFVNDAFFQEMGITTPDDGRGFSFPTDNDPMPDPELSAAEVDDVHTFLSQLPAPARAGSTDPRVDRGLEVFYEVGCFKCHRPVLQGTGGPVPLYSDLLLHNVMPVGFRGMSEEGAGVGLYRTPPLWGIRHTAPYMHDGRAETLPEAIAHHDGEALGVRQAYEALTPADQQALILFLEDL